MSKINLLHKIIYLDKQKNRTFCCVLNNCCVYKDQQTNIYYTTVKNVLYFGEIQSSDDKLSVNINGTENELSNDIWFKTIARKILIVFDLITQKCIQTYLLF